MATFSDPQTITINSVPFDLNLVSVEGQKKTYQSADAKMILVISHQKSGDRSRHLFGFTQKVLAADPLTGTNKEKSMTVNFTVDEPFGADWAFNDVYIGQVIEGLKTLFSSASQTKFLAGQS